MPCANGTSPIGSRVVHHCVHVCALRLLQAAQARAEEAEASLRGLRTQAEQAKQQAVEQQAQLEGQLSELKQQLARATAAQQLQVGCCGAGCQHGSMGPTVYKHGKSH